MSSATGISYQQLITHIVPGPNSISYFISLLLLPTALLVPPTVLSHSQLYYVFFPPILGCYLHSCFFGGGIDVISTNVVLWSFVLLALHDPRKSFRRMRFTNMPDLSRESGGTTFKKDCAVVQLDESSLSKDRLRFWEESYPSLIPNRIAWVLTLIVSIRLSYWKTGDLLHDKTQPPRRITRLAFLRYALTTIVQSYIIVDAAAFYNLHDPFFAHPTMSIDTPFPPPEKDMPIILVLLRMLPPRLVRSASVAAHAYGLISLGGAFPTIFNVLANKLGLIPELWSAHTWPIFFGRFSAVWERGLRGFWGTWWHQTMRYLTSAPGRSLSRRLGYPEHSLVDYALRTTTAFAFSGLVHAGLVPPEPLFATKPAWKIRLYITGFFWAQIPAIGVELLVSRFGRRFFPNAWKQWWVKILAVTWVCSWFSFTIPILAVALKELGYWRSYPFSLSVWQGLSGRGWFPWLEAR